MYPLVISESSNLAFSITLVQLEILKYLPIHEMKQFRLVSASFNFTTLPILFKRSSILLNVPKISKKELKTVEENSEIEQFLNNKLKGVQNLKFIIDAYNSKYEFPVLKLLKNYSSTLVELNYCLKGSGIANYDWLLQLILPQLTKLKKLTLDIEIFKKTVDTLPPIFPTEVTPITELVLKLYEEDYSGPPRIKDEEITQAVLDFPRIFPNVETLVFGYEELSNKFARTILFDDRIRLNFKHLRAIELESAIDKDWLQFSNFTYCHALTRLSIGFEVHASTQENLVSMANAYENLLWNHAQTLECLTIRTRTLGDKKKPVDMIVPRMPQLISLTLVHKDYEKEILKISCYIRLMFPSQENFGRQNTQYNSSEYLDYEIQFPKLVNLNFELKGKREIIKMKPLLDVFMPLCQQPPARCRTLKNLNIIDMSESEWKDPYLKHYLFSVGRIFPNVHIPMLEEIRLELDPELWIPFLQIDGL